MTALVDARDVTVRFGGIVAVDGVSLVLEPGRLYGIVGPNGSGKTTLLNSLSRMQRLTSGSICVDGDDITNRGPADAARHGLSRTFQAIRLSPSLTVRENVMAGADLVSGGASVVGWTLLSRRARAAEREAREAADNVLRRVGLYHVAGESPAALPYGYQRRVEIARALATRPRVLLLDEPTAGMNESERHEVTRLLRQLRDEGIAQVLVEHNLRMMMTACEHLFVMHFGKLLLEGEPKVVARDERVREAYLGSGRRGAA